MTEAELNAAIDDYATSANGQQPDADSLREVADRLSIASQLYPAERISEIIRDRIRSTAPDEPGDER